MQMDSHRIFEVQIFGLGYVIFAAGFALAAFARLFVGRDEGVCTWPSMPTTNRSYITFLYTNILYVCYAKTHSNCE